MGYQTFQPALQIDGRQYEFPIGVESVDLGPAGVVDYLSFDGGDVREVGGGINGQMIVEAWWAMCRQQQGDGVDLYDREHLLKASAYLRLCTSHALQDVYRCSFLAPAASRNVRLDSLLIKDLKSIVEQRSITLVRQAMEGCLLMDLPPAVELPAYQLAASKLTGLGHCLLRLNLPDAVDVYLQRLIPYMHKLRRQGEAKLGANGRGDRVRRMLNFFSYECLACFHQCASAVLLKLTRGLLTGDKISARFNGMMHDCWRNDSEEGVLSADHRGLLGGQILSLHPIGRWLLTRQEHRHAIGAWIASNDYGRLSPEQTLAHPLYRGALLAVLCAAHEYRQAHEQYEQERHSHPPLAGDLSREQDAGGGVEPARDDAPPPEMELFEQLARRYQVHCKSCGGAVEYIRWEPAQRSMTSIHFRCRGCEAPVTRRFTREQFQIALAAAS